MFVFIGMGLLIGGLLGARFTVVALFPAVVLALSAAALRWVGIAEVPEWGALHLFGFVVSLQIGYLGGAGVRLFVALRPLVRWQSRAP